MLVVGKDFGDGKAMDTAGVKDDGRGRAEGHPKGQLYVTGAPCCARKWHLVGTRRPRRHSLERSGLSELTVQVSPLIR
jgi:hypothetical protein